MSPIIIACMVAACLVSQTKVGAGSQASSSTENSATTGPPAPGNLCQLQPYNIINLTRENYWFANSSDGSCCFDNATSCTFYFAFCHPVNGTVCPGGAAVCQVGETASGTPTSYSMGQFTNDTQFYQNNGTVEGGFYMDVVNGSNAECKTGVSTRIVLVCNSTTLWKQQDLSDIIQVESTKRCSYTITLPYAGACLPVVSPTATKAVMPSTTSVKPTTTSMKPLHSAITTSSMKPHSTESSATTTSSMKPHTAITTTPGVATTTKATSLPSSVATTSMHAGTTTPVTPKPTPPGPVTTHPKPPTTHKNPTTKEPTAQPVNGNDESVKNGLIAGVVIFALISVVLLVMLIFAARTLYLKKGQYRRISNNDDM